MSSSRGEVVSRKLRSKDIQASDSPKKSISIAQKRTTFADLYDDLETKYSVVERAERVHERLENELPHFVKYMIKSNVEDGFWLHPPRDFCRKYLPKRNTSIALVDEWGTEYTTTYLYKSLGLSAGWKGFCEAHKLKIGDILFFHMTASREFKVHMVRVHDVDEDVLSAALCLMDMDASARGNNSDLVKTRKRRGRKPKHGVPYQRVIASPVENFKVENSIPSPVSDRSSNPFLLGNGSKRS